jgi:hypothetical protein
MKNCNRFTNFEIRTCDALNVMIKIRGILYATLTLIYNILRANHALYFQAKLTLCFTLLHLSK